MKARVGLLEQKIKWNCNSKESKKERAIAFIYIRHNWDYPSPTAYTEKCRTLFYLYEYVTPAVRIILQNCKDKAEQCLILRKLEAETGLARTLDKKTGQEEYYVIVGGPQSVRPFEDKIRVEKSILKEDF